MRKTSTVGNLALDGFDDIFQTCASIASQPQSGESIVDVLLAELHAPEFHPFQVNDDLAMYRLAESIRQYGVREPGIVRPLESGGYELLCGNRRKRACELASISTLPVIIRELDDSSAALVMVDSNLDQREKILPSERAWAYRIMMEALNHKGVKGEIYSHEIIVERTGVKKSLLFRIMRLTELIVVLADKVDSNQLAFNPAVELSYLSVSEQTSVAEVMEAYEVKPSLSQAKRLKELKQNGKLTDDMIDRVLSEVKKPPKSEPSSSMRFRKFFPADFSQKQINDAIIKLLKDWKEGRAL